jgi:hypothetical protein
MWHLDEKHSHHEGREGHEDRITERASNLRKNIFLRALRVLRGDIRFSFGWALPRCVSLVNTPSRRSRRSLSPLYSLDSERLHKVQKVGLVQAENPRSGGSIAPGGRQSPPDDIRSGSVYGCAIGQTLRGSFRF